MIHRIPKAGVRPVCLLALSLALLVGATPGWTAVGHDHDDAYEVSGPATAEPTRWALPEQEGLAPEPARVSEIRRDAESWGLAGQSLPLHRMVSLGITRDLAVRDADAASRAIARDFPALTAVSDESMELASVKNALHMTYVDYRQTVDGYPVLGSRISFHWDDAGRLRLTGSDVFQSEIGIVPASLRSPRWMSEPAARAAALEGMPAELEVREWEHAERAWLPLAAGNSAGFELAPVWNVRFRTETPPGWYDTVVDGETGSLISRTNRILFEKFDGQVIGLIERNTVGDFFEELGMPEAEARLVGTSESFALTTDLEGGLSADVPAGEYVLETSLAGSRILVQDASGGFDQLITPETSIGVTVPDNSGDPTAGVVLWEQANSSESHRDAYYHGNIAYQFIRSIDGTPGVAELDSPMQTVVDDASGRCNAYWNGTRMNFYAAGGACAATARIADVVYHEYGHAVTQFTYEPFFAPLDIHEGFSDYLAATMRDDPFIGRGFFGPNTTLRDIETDLVYPDDVDSDPHVTGLIIAGALWDLRKEIGAERTDELWHFARYAGAGSFDDFLVDMLILDDDDADLSNGSPNSGPIVANFRAHGIGDYAVALSGFEQPDVENPGLNLRVSTRVWSLLPIDETGSAFFYSVDTATDFTRAALQRGEGGQWFAEIPAPPEGSTIYYYWSIANNVGDLTVIPENAPAAALSFFVGRDLVPPTIAHLEPTALPSDAPRLHLRAEVRDNSQQISAVNVEYSVGGGEAETVAMSIMDGDIWEASLSIPSSSAGEVSYRIVAQDRSQAGNTTAFPADREILVPIRAGWSSDFEDNDAGMRPTNDWEWGSSPIGAWSGTNVWGTRLDRSYSDQTVSTLTWGPFDLSSFDRARLEFRHFYRFEDHYDGALVEISVVGEDLWAPIIPSGGYDGHIDALDRDGFTGILEDWEEVLIPLDLYLGQEIEVRFRVASDVFLADLGWYIDDLAVVQAQGLADPKEFTLEDGMDQRIELAWRNPQGIDLSSDRWIGFHLYRRPDGGEEVRLTDEPVRVFSWVDTSLDNGVPYIYRLTSLYDDGESRGALARGTAFAATVGIDVESLGMVVTGYGAETRQFQVENLGSGTLEFDSYVVEPGAPLSSVVATHTLTGAAADPVLVIEDAEDGSEVVDVSALLIEEFMVDEVPWVRIHVQGHGWSNPRSDWGGFLAIDTDENLATSQGDFATPWGETFNMGYEYGILFGNLPAQVGIPGGLLGFFFSADQAIGDVVPLVDFPTDGSPISLAIPQSWLGGADDIRIGLSVGPTFGLPVADTLPDAPKAIQWLTRSPKHGRSTTTVKQTIQVVFENDNLPSGTYSADIMISSNDPLNPEVRLPISVQVDRTAPPPDLAAQLALPTIAGMNVRFLPRPTLPAEEAFIEREELDGTWRRLGGPLSPDLSGFYGFLDRDVRQGLAYRYRFPIVYEGGASMTYGPLEAFFQPTAPELAASSSESLPEGLEVRFQLSPEVPVQSSDLYRRVRMADGSEVEYEVVATGIEADTENVIRHVDDSAQFGVDYEYRVDVFTETGVTIDYGPLEARREATFPAQLPDLAFGSGNEGLSLSFSLPEVFNPLVGVWLDRRLSGVEEWSLIVEEPLLPDVEGRVSFFDPWGTPFNNGVEPEEAYEYRIRIRVAEETVTYVEPARFTPPTPVELQLHAPKPNPFRDQVVIRLDLPQTSRVRLEVYDVSGRRRAVIEDGEMSAGSHQMVWDGRDDLGQDLGSGVYWMRFEGESAQRSLRILRTK